MSVHARNAWCPRGFFRTETLCWRPKCCHLQKNTTEATTSRKTNTPTTLPRIGAIEDRSPGWEPSCPGRSRSSQCSPVHPATQLQCTETVRFVVKACSFCLSTERSTNLSRHCTNETALRSRLSKTEPSGISKCLSQQNVSQHVAHGTDLQLGMESASGTQDPLFLQIENRE